MEENIFDKVQEVDLQKKMEESALAIMSCRQNQKYLIFHIREMFIKLRHLKK